ncbi:AP-2 complex subunit alpha-2 [Phytophthora pseudosyringae]|uniref:AP-2 complex subunit alpha-2 n=1 Tax=Phytophthora pseudosyringae TaxID=221518 RepID=A0A8T1VRE8_9STRA|nr:AP-2 complex subunit alpha-2 [Phytophthora pseudosyringae]
MPVFPENRESELIDRLRNQQKAAASVDEGSVLPEEGATSPPAQASVGTCCSRRRFRVVVAGGSGGLRDLVSFRLGSWTGSHPWTQLSIGAKHEYRGSQGRINLFYDNKTSDMLKGFAVQLETGNFFRVQAEGYRPSPSMHGVPDWKAMEDAGEDFGVDRCNISRTARGLA